jgi:hypothetical protein
MKSVQLATLSLTLAACYGAAPPKPARIPLPPPVEGGQISVYSEDKTTFENISKSASTCPQGKGEGSPECTVTRYTVKEPVTRTYSTATYADQPISYAQFKVMTDPQYDRKLVRLDDLSHTCTRANVPRYAGMVGLVAGLVVGPIVGGTAGTIVMAGGLVGGTGSYALGYFAFGGRDCNEARAIYNDVEVGHAVGMTSVTGSQLAVEMQELAGRFNASQGATQSAMQMR